MTGSHPRETVSKASFTDLSRAYVITPPDVPLRVRAYLPLSNPSRFGPDYKPWQSKPDIILLRTLLHAREHRARLTGLPLGAPDGSTQFPMATPIRSTRSAVQSVGPFWKRIFHTEYTE